MNFASTFGMLRPDPVSFRFSSLAQTISFVVAVFFTAFFSMSRASGAEARGTDSRAQLPPILQWDAALGAPTFRSECLLMWAGLLSQPPRPLIRIECSVADPDGGGSRPLRADVFGLSRPQTEMPYGKRFLPGERLISDGPLEIWMWSLDGSPLGKYSVSRPSGEQR